ncbi:MAG: FAD-dependent oxidoreductase [Lachnospiraceae bacterium]|jgi:2,4-dienoyl-CoA reductase-like NADH-dependent reductase (Old Yellow Enzyme family)/thioredoxin reductase|nr:FAD-dependent oxidoreductase [Lachnospiraceae bacterium]
MNQYFPNLFRPMKVKNVTYRNRIFMAPTALKELSDHNYVDYHTFDYLERRAKGGAASITLGEGIVHETGTVEWSKKLHLWEDRAEPGLYTLATRVRAHGAIACQELNHAGMHFHDDDRINYGPSDCVDTFDQGDGKGKRVHKITAMPSEVIEEVVEAYGKAALRAKHCGFQSVLVHAGHGWLIAQFLSPVLNKRTDEFGGSFENRARLATMIIDRIRKYCGNNFVIEARVSWMEGLTEGYQLNESIEFCKLLEKHGVDMIHITAGSLHYPETTNFSHPSWFDLPEGKNLEAASEIKKHLHIPVGTVGSVTDPRKMEEWIAEGKLDYVVCARALVADPDLPRKAMEGRCEDIRPCLRCISCLTGGYYDLPMHCSVNPQVGRDSDFRFQLPSGTKKKKVLIAGGGPAGMECALTAAEQGHEVILCEKEDHLGGLLPVIEIEPFKIRIKMYREWLERQIGKSNIDVRLSTEVTPELVAQINPDKLIAAVGAYPINAPVPGIENAVNIVDFYRQKMPETGENVVVIGGGFAGVECAIGLAQTGKKVIVVEMCDAIASGPNTPYPGTGAMQIDALWFHANKNHVDIRLNTKCVEVKDGVVVCESKDGTRYELKADTIISAGGMKPKEELVDALRETVSDFSWIGDCYSPGLIRTAVEMGYNTALDI